ncbi:PIN domain-containing protein [Geodermatophilus sp. DF01-2]|uniref:PIN domain-containing protein n=1 Tax=Geodermatophilus sp. DF01-2 TaxID=2559610 RepID=UPI0010732DE3|nr:PIN domain-containing protein [Geodermatophilus sp. DF01_2]TFV57747.1 PIN domain-containing protein [Geodermatophilus sp. DF01_2]
MTGRRVVVDASAVLAFVLRERAAAVVAQILPYAVITAANMTEVLYRAPERGYRNSPQTLFAELLSTDLEVEPVTEDDSVRAAELVAASRAARSTADDRSLSLGDGICIAVAERLGLPVTGGDTHWGTLDLKTQFFPLRGG